MTKEEKKLLLNVLKDGLPYGLKLQITDYDEFTFNGELRVLSKNWCRLNIADPVKRARVKNQTIPLNCIYIKPYLRSMSSMTDEEREHLQSLHNIISDENYEDGYSPAAWETILEFNDYCHEHHLDNRGLIEIGLALEAPEHMYD